MNKNSYKILIYAAVLGCIKTNAQSADSFREEANIMPGVESWRIATHGDIAPTLYTGAMQWSLPLYTYKDFDFTLPISLQYCYDGFRPKESTGTIGLGWALNAGGVITREVRGLRDEYIKQTEKDNKPIYGYYYAWKNSVDLEPQNFRLLRGPARYLDVEDYGDHSFLELIQDNLAEDIIVCQSAKSNELYDTEPDIFRFNFCGHSGEFRFGVNGAIDVFCSNERERDFDISTNTISGPDCASFSFKITTSDGYEYTFGGTPESLEYCTNTCYYTENPKGYQQTMGSGNQTITAWKLTSIKSPNGRSLVFDYDKTPNIEASAFESYTPSLERLDEDADEKEVIPSYREKWLSINRTRLLKRISLRDSKLNQTLLDFVWKVRTNEQNELCSENYSEGETLLSEVRAASGNTRNKILSEIKVRNGIVEDIKLIHGIMGTPIGTRRLLLESVDTKTSGKWSFKYNSNPTDTPIPVADVNIDVDIYGYWGGQSPLDLRGHEDVNGGGLRFQGVCENYSLPKAQTGALSQIIYPTGGSTEIEYEKNKVSRLLERDWDNDSPYPYPFEKEVSGIRIRKIADYDGQETAYVKSYRYKDGILWHYPRLTAQCNYIKTIYAVSGPASSPIRLKANYYAKTGFGVSKNSPRLGYGTVTEIMPDQSYTTYSFNGWDEYPDVYTKSYAFINTDISPLNDRTQNKMLSMFLPASSDWSLFRGTLKSIDMYDSSDNIRQQHKYFYTSSASSTIYEGERLFSIYLNMPKYRFKPLLVSTIATVNGLSTETKWETDGAGRLRSETITDLQSGYSKANFYSYCDGLTSSDASTLPGAIREIKTFVKTNHSSEELVTDHIRFAFNRKDGSAKPISMTKLLTDTPMRDKDRAPHLRYETYTMDRDAHLRPLQINFPGGGYIAYKWDSTGRNIISKTVNGVQNVTNYIWEDMIGLTSIKYPSGLSNKYTYDKYNRLSEIKNEDSHLIRRIEGRLSSEIDGKKSRIAYVNYLDNTGVSYTMDMEYYDGLGRKTQNVNIGITGKFPSIITPTVYDNMGRSDETIFLPFSSESLSKSSLADYYEDDWQKTLSQWYEDKYNDGNYPFAKREYEPWQNGRLLSEQKAGKNFRLYGKKKINNYSKNTEKDSVMNFSIAQYSLDSALVKCIGFWNASKLNKQVRVTEEGDTTIIFSDVMGRTLLFRAIDKCINHDTYYIRDCRDSLVMVIQPEGSIRLQTDTEILFTEEFAHDYCFFNLYDGYGRLVWKHTPGDGGTRYVYDKKGRLSYADDASLRHKGEGRYYIYDSYDRLVEEGICSPQSNIDDIREGLLYGLSISELSANAKYVRKISYRTVSSPSGDIPDDMLFRPVNEIVKESDVDLRRCLNMVSFESLREISNDIGRNTYRAYWYNAQGRLIQMLEKTSDGWTSRYSTKYDFVGNVTAFCEEHTDPSGTTHTLLTHKDFDERGRITRSIQTLDGEEYSPVEYEYDDLGRLRYKTQGAIKVTVQRDILGNTTEIRVTNSKGRLSFKESLKYRFDGLINETTVINSQNNDKDEFSVKNLYAYDHLGRLSENRRWINNTETEIGTEKRIEYDLNGNLTFISRNETGILDDYYFEYKGNVPTVGYKNPQSDFIELWFSSDLNGNLTSSSLGDLNISYNFLNLPMRSNGITYTYLSDETKLSAKIPDGTATIYRGSFIYSVNQTGSISLQSVESPDGRIYCSGTPDGEPWACWNVTDHLGNIRQILLTASAMPIEVNDYLPFGQRIEGYSSSYLKDLQHWGYSGKEYQSFGGYDSSLIDFGARYYSPHFCRWTGIDPLAEKFPYSSPYAYCAGNPINYVDPTGEAWYETRAISIDNYKISFNLAYRWTEAKSQEELNSMGIVGRFLGDAVVIFNGFYDEHLDNNGHFGTKASKSASVIVYGPEGENDINYYIGYTMSSDPKQFGVISNGDFLVKRVPKHGTYEKEWAIYSLDNNNKVKALNGYNPAFPERIPGWLDGTYIHRSNWDGFAGYNKKNNQAVSKGCPLILGEQWEAFSRQLKSVNNLFLIINRE